MPRNKRIEYTGAIYHLMSRADRREDLAARRKSDREKVAIAMWLRQEVTLAIKQLASRLSLGTPRSASTRLREWQFARTSERGLSK